MTGKRRRLLLVAFSCVLLAATAALSSPLYEWKNYYPQHSSPAEAKMLKADGYFNAVETEAVQKTYTEAIAIDPMFAPACGNRAKTWLELGKNKEAFKDLDEAISCANKLYRRLVLRDRAELHKDTKPELRTFIL